jgi:LSD1 subclass zinc finger protein
MPFDIACTNCKRLLRVPDEGAGKHVKCPQCQTVVLAPTQGGEVANVGVSTAEMWHVKGGDGQTYGPVPRSELDNWCREGRLAASSQILREGAAQWQWATDVYPHLAQTTPLGGGQYNGHSSTGVATTNPYGQAHTAAYNPYSGASSYNGGYGGYSNPHNLSDKSKIAAGLLGLFLGAYGIHRFYLGDTGIGIAQIIVTLVTCGIGGLWGPIEGIMILCGAIDRDAMGRKLRD